MCVCDFIGYLSVSRTRDLKATCIERPCNSAWFHLSVGDLSVAILPVTLEPSRDVLVSTVEFMGYFFHRTELLESFGSCAAMRSLQPNSMLASGCLEHISCGICLHKSTRDCKSITILIILWQVDRWQVYT